MKYDPMHVLDEEGNQVVDHPLLGRPIDDMDLIAPPRIRRVEVGDVTVDALVEPWTWDGLRGHSLCFLTKDLEGVSDEVVMASCAAFFGLDLAAKKGEPRAGGVSVTRKETYVFATAAFYSDYED